MSGHDSNQQGGTPVGFTQEELAGFTQHYGPDASRLVGVFEKNGRYYNNVGKDASQQQDVTDLMNNFKTWMRDTGAANAAREKYIQLKKEQPGRQATLITPYAGTQSQTILGQPPSASNTVLG